MGDDDRKTPDEQPPGCLRCGKPCSVSYGAGYCWPCFDKQPPRRLKRYGRW